MMIPRYSPQYSYKDLFSCLKNSSIDFTKELAGKLASLYNRKHVFLFNRASSALYALLKAYGAKGGVILPAYNCIVVPETVLYAGYKPEFADIDNKTLNMSGSTVERGLSASTSAILITHQYGIPSPIDEILAVCKRKNLLIIEDAAPAIGATYRGKLVGSFGDAAIISFHQTKILSGVNGGALLTDNDDIAQSVGKLFQTAYYFKNKITTFLKAFAWKTALTPRIYGFSYFLYRFFHGIKLYDVVTPHYGMPKHFISKCSSFTLAMVNKQMDDLPSILEHRRELASLYTEKLSGSGSWDLLQLPPDCLPAWTQFPILAKNKKDFYDYMLANGVDLSWTHKYSCAESFNLTGYPGARRAANSVVGLPTYPSLGKKRAEYICEKARRFENAARR